MGVGTSRPITAQEEQQKELQKEVIKFPEKVYVVISTHGKISIDIDASSNDIGKIKLYKIPDGITITKISPVTPGTCNYLDQQHLNKVIDFIKNTIDKSGTQPQAQSEPISRKRKLQEKTPEELIADFLKVEPFTQEMRKELKIKKYIDEEQRNYIYSTRSSLNTYQSGKSIPDKTYSYDNLDPIEPANFIKEIESNKTFDVLEVLKKITHETYDGKELITTSTTEKEIVDFFKNHGVKEIVLIDLSCSVFSDEEGNYPSSRSRRALRRGLKTQGGRKNKNKKRNRTRKYKIR